MDLPIFAVTLQTIRESIRTKWFLMYTPVFFLLAINVPIVLLLTLQFLPPDYLLTYLTYLVSLSFPYLPLLPLLLGATSIVEERESGTLQYVLSNPISRSEFLTGRYLGLLISTTAVIIIGYGAAGIVGYTTNFTEYALFAKIIVIASVLNASMLGLSLLVSVLTKRKATAISAVVVLWFILAIVSDFQDLTTLVSLTAGRFLVLSLTLINPIECARLLATFSLGLPPDRLPGAIGTPGLVLLNLMQDLAVPALIIDLAIWVSALFLGCLVAFRRQDVR